ncbi:MAG: tetratricopeptide repeat protein [Candidatus Eisenbacteria bacterium]|nr:tetratricopeptide repeat protein [Candidatus Eisenbacteria bacterium]
MRGRTGGYGRREGAAVALALLASFALRLLYLRELSHTPFFSYPIIDAAEYWGWATRIASGEWLWQRVHIHGPFYPYFLALLQRAGGSQPAAYVVQHLLGLGVLLLLYDLTRALCGRTAAWIALLAAALYPRFLWFEGQLLATTWVILLDLLLLRIAVELARRRSRPAAWIAVGVLAGLSAITRPTVLVTLPAILFWAARLRAPRGALRAAAILAGTAALIAPVAVRNAAIGDPVPIQSNGGMNFYIANRTGADGLASVRPGIEWKRIERLADEVGTGRQSDLDRFYYREGLEEMAADPAGALRRIGKRFLLFWGGWEVDTSQDFGWFRDACPALGIPFLTAGAILPFAVLGVFSALRRRPLENLPLLFLLSYVVAVLFFPYASRYRMPVFPLLVLFAASALPGVLRGMRERPPRAAGAVTAAVLFLLLNGTPLRLPENGLVRVELHLGKRLDERGDLGGALAQYDRALERNPDDPDVWNNRGLVLEAMGEEEEARYAYERVLRVAPDHAKARANLAGIHFRNGRTDSAEVEMEKAIRWEPRNPDLRNNLGALLLQRGDLDEAVRQLEIGRASAPRNREVLYNLARAYEKVGRFAEARGALEDLVGIEESKQVRVRLGWVFEQEDRPAEAAREYAAALRIDPDFPEALRRLGFLFLRAGRAEEAIPCLERYLVLRPEDGVVRDLLERNGAGSFPPTRSSSHSDDGESTAAD